MSAPSGDDDDRTVITPATPAGAPSFAPTVETPSDRSQATRTLLDTHALPLGTRLGEFELVQKIGEGGFSIVYLARDHSLDRRVALKEYMPTSIAARAGGTEVNPRSERHRETFEAGLRSFINEAKLLARFDHPSLVKVYRFWEANGTAYMVMPFYEGVTLKDSVRALREPPDEAWLLGVLAPLTEALTVIHAEHCYHRDIAPDNVILLAVSGLPLLLDFGAARRVIGDMTQALTIILKPGYAPVEQYAEVPGMRQGPWTDVYALAAVVYWAITGKTPPPSVGRMLKDSHVPLAECAAGRYSPAFLQAIDRALVVLPERRTQTIAVLQRELGLADPGPDHAAAPAPWVDPAATVILPPGEPDVSARPGQRRAALGAAAVAVALTAAGLWWALHKPTVEPLPPTTASTKPAAPAAQQPPSTPASAVEAAAVAAPPSVDAAPAPVAQAPVPPARASALPPPPHKPAHLTPKPVPAPAQAEHRAEEAIGNSAECARIIQRLSLGESNPELLERVKLLKCR